MCKIKLITLKRKKVVYIVYSVKQGEQEKKKKGEWRFLDTAKGSFMEERQIFIFYKTTVPSGCKREKHFQNRTERLNRVRKVAALSI